MHPKNIRIADYRYELPDEAIATHPLPERDASRLLVYQQGDITETTYRDIATVIPAGSLLVFNNTKVVEARIIFTKPSGGKIEVFCLEPPPAYGGVGQAMSQTGRVEWKCLIGGASKWKPGQILTRIIDNNPASTAPSVDSIIAPGTNMPEPYTLEARYIDKLDGAFLIEFTWTPSTLSFAELLHRAGLIPLPPYIRRTPDAADSQRYQTVYAQHDGSVAAPTAGLHFTNAIFNDLAQKNIATTYVTLHVGAGTFLPVKATTMEGHNMHVEYIEVQRTTIDQLLQHLQTPAPGAPQSSSPGSTPSSSAAAAQPPPRPSTDGSSPGTPPAAPTASVHRRIIPVGTTSARTLESLYWLGLKTIQTPDTTPEALVIHQWDAYELPGTATPIAALTALRDWMDKQGLSTLRTRTQLLITPGYRWRIAAALVTNFHQPESTLLLLVASLIGEDWRKVYTYAQTNGFRFLSYGDGSLLFPTTTA